MTKAVSFTATPLLKKLWGFNLCVINRKMDTFGKKRIRDSEVSDLLNASVDERDFPK
jgi:hypothetical protein